MASYAMAPNSSSTSTVTRTVEDDSDQADQRLPEDGEADINSNVLRSADQEAGSGRKDWLVKGHDVNYKHEIVWINVLKLGFLHCSALYGLYLLAFSTTWPILPYMLILSICSGLGTTAGAHRLWSHRTYKATLSLRILLAIFNSIACQNDIYDWSRDHRVHHKFSETDADPYNVNRGFFFSHVGWLMVKKHPEVVKRGQSIDLSDLRADKVVMFQRKYYYPMAILFGFVIPALIPYYLWGETLFNAFVVCDLLRYAFTLNMTWLVNSAAHMWGNKPYDQYLTARQNTFVAFGALGEGFHNYHHSFPWDYATSELGWTLNLTTIFIDLMAAIGWARDRKTVSAEHIKQRMERTGEHSDDHHHEH